jgi:hypothetical protein
MLNDDNPVGVAMVPDFVPAAVAMSAEFGPRAEVTMIAVPDHDVLSTCNRWCRDSDRAKRGKNVSKLPHVVLLG